MIVENLTKMALTSVTHNSPILQIFFPHGTCGHNRTLRQPFNSTRSCLMWKCKEIGISGLERVSEEN